MTVPLRLARREGGSPRSLSSEKPSFGVVALVGVVAHEEFLFKNLANVQQIFLRGRKPANAMKIRTCEILMCHERKLANNPDGDVHHLKNDFLLQQLM